MTVTKLSAPRRLSTSGMGGSLPLSIANLAAWYDAGAASSLFDAVSGGSNSAADAAVMRWQDLSGNGNHLTQPANTTNNAPLRKVSDTNLGGRDGLLFDGSNDVLQTSTTINTGAGATMFIVHKFQSNQDRGMHTFTGASAANHHPFGSSFFDGFGNATRRNWTQAYSANRRLYSIISGTSWIAHLNGTAVNTITGVSPAAQFANRPQCFGAGDNTAGTTIAGFANVYMCEIIIYTRVLTTSEHTTVSNYLIAKWGL